MKREANFQTIFNHWLKDVREEIFVFKIPDCGYQNPFDCFSVDKNGKFTAWELKQTQTDSISFNSVVDHQVTSLEVVNGYVVIYYALIRTFCLIHIKHFIKEKAQSKRKSLMSSRAVDISELTIRL